MQKSALYEELGRRIIECRGDMTQRELAEKVHISRASIANIERGNQAVSLHNLYAIAAALGIQDLRELLPVPQGASSKLVEVKSFDEIGSRDHASVNEFFNRFSVASKSRVSK